MSDYDAEIVSVQTEDGRIGFSTTGFHKENLKEEADKMGLSLSAACRYWISSGLRLHDELDPRNGDFEPTTTEESDALTSFIVSSIPEGEDNAEHMDEIIEQLQDEIEDRFLDVIEDQDNINRDGWEVSK